MFLKPLKKVVFDLGIFFLINVACVYCMLFFIKDTMVAMTAAVWVGLIAWRGGVFAGLLGCGFIYISNYLAIKMPPHENVIMAFYFDNRVPGFMIGLFQSILVSTVVGYISTLNHKLRNEIQLREKTQKDLEQKIAELDAFGHTVAHNLKNPLMVINMSIDSLNKEYGSGGNVKAKEKLAFISDGSKQMIDIIEAILLLAGVKKIDQNNFSIFPVSISVNDALKRMAYNIKSNGVEIKTPDNWPSVFGYAPWITEVWANYISNAIKYGGKPVLHIKPVIELGYDKPEIDHITNHEFIRFWVKDNGVGIEKEKSATLFKEFTRLHTTEQEGHGLGLSIVKTIINRFDGIAGVESNVGNGSLFYFTLPVTKVESI